MIQFFTRNSQSKINFSKRTSEYAYPNREQGVVAYIVTAGKSFVAVTSYGAAQGEREDAVGKYVAMSVQSDVARDRTTYRKIVGFVDENEKWHGNVPTKNLQHYVMK
jgi:hypothetical protein